MRNIIVTAALLYAAPSARDHTVPVLALELAQPSSTGVASWYGPGFDGRLTASGAVFQASARTAAHRTLPFGTIVVVQDEESGRAVEVVVNDRGPFAGNRIIDLSEAAAEDLGMTEKGLTTVALYIADR